MAPQKIRVDSVGYGFGVNCNIACAVGSHYHEVINRQAKSRHLCSVLVLKKLGYKKYSQISMESRKEKSNKKQEKRKRRKKAKKTRKNKKKEKRKKKKKKP